MNKYFSVLKNNGVFDEMAPDNIFSLCLKGITFSIYTKDSHRKLLDPVTKWYRDFISNSSSSDFIVKYYLYRDLDHVLREYLTHESEEYRNIKVITQSDYLKEDEIAVFRWDMRALFNVKDKRANVILLNESPESFDAAVRIAASFLLPHKKCLLIHGSSIVINGEGFVFFGKSGSGKSTIAGLSKSIVLNDEISLLSIEDDGSVNVSGTPFYGDLKQGTNIIVPLNKIFLLRQDKDIYIEYIPKHAQMLNLLQCIITFMTGRNDYQMLLDICSLIIDKKGIEVLHFENNDKFMDVLS